MSFIGNEEAIHSLIKSVDLLAERIEKLEAENYRLNPTNAHVCSHADMTEYP